MPTKYNSQETRDTARHVAEKLGIEYIIIPISDLVESNRSLVSRTFVEKLDSILEQNIQAKARMLILSNLAQKYNGLYTSNSNKWEIATGYCTLDGDARGALAPIGDLTKSEIIQLARYLNEHIFKIEVIPQPLIELRILPSPELEQQQAEPLKLGYHCSLVEAFMDYKAKSAEDIMQWYIDGTLEQNLGIPTELIKEYGIDNPGEFIKDLEWFNSQVQKSVFKRIQGQPIILLTKTAYGYDRRESILPQNSTSNHDELRTRILSMKSYVPQRAVQSN